MTAAKTLNSLYLAAFLPIFGEYGTLSAARAFARFFPLMQKPYDPFPVPPSCVWHPAPTALPLGSLGDDQSVVVHPQPRPQPPGVLRPAKSFTDRPRRGRHRMQQGRPAAPGVAGFSRYAGRTRRVLLPDAGARLDRPPGQTRRAAD